MFKGVQHSTQRISKYIIESDIYGCAGNQCDYAKHCRFIQTNIIRTCSSLWETGSDYLFSWTDTKAPVSATGYGESQLLNQEGRRRRKRPNKRKKGGCSRLHGASALCVLTFCLSASFGGKCVSLGNDSSDIALWVAKNLVDLVLDF